MNKNVCISWSGIMELSVSMLSLAKEEKWEVLAKLEKSRSELIHAFFEQADAKQEPAKLKDDILEVLALDQKIIQICQFRKSSISEKLNLFRDSRRAKNAYSRNSY